MAALRQRVTFDPTAHATSSQANGDPTEPSVKRKKAGRRVSVTSSMDMIAGKADDVSQPGDDDTDHLRKRYSRRKSTVDSTTRTTERIEEYEARKVQGLCDAARVSSPDARFTRRLP
jgi:hypothetical protein